MATKLEMLLEGERRGILPPEKLAVLQESRKRGLIPGQGPQDFAQKATLPMEAGDRPIAPALPEGAYDKGAVLPLSLIHI